MKRGHNAVGTEPITAARARKRITAVTVLIVAAGLASLACMLFTSCAVPQINLLERTTFAQPDSEAAWARYHWYAADMRFGFSSRDYTENSYRWIRTFTEFSLVAKVLTTEGSQVGTIPLPGWNRTLLHLDVDLYDSALVRIPFDRHTLDSIFREKSVLVIPKVQHGCIIAVRIKQGPYGPYNFMEFPIAMSAPVHRLTLTASYPKNLRYDFHAYHGMSAPVDSLKHGVRFLSWTVDHVLPVPDLPFLDAAAARPSLEMVSRYNQDGEGFRDWAAVAKFTAKERFKQALLSTHGKAAKRARELSQGSPDAPETARRILAWVQDNITFQDDSRDERDPDEVLEEQRGSRWQLATLLSVMYKEAGLENEILLSRPREYGGLDPAAPNPMAVWEPVVAVKAGGREWAACPHLRWFGLGGYPDGLFGMQALSLKAGVVRPLPAPAPDFFSLETKETLSALTPGRRSLEITLDGIAASQAREVIPSGCASPAACGRILSSFGFDPAVESCSEEDSDRRDRPLRLKVTAKSGFLLVAGGRNPRVKVEAAFSRAAWFYDSARAEPYLLPYELRRKETVTLPRGNAASGADAGLACVERKNAVFEVTCKRSPAEGGLAIVREVVIHPGLYPAAAWSALNGEVAALASSTPAVLQRP